MKYAQLVFSPTGGTEKAAAAITKEWGQDVETVDLTDGSRQFSQIAFQEGDLVLIAVPSYGGRVPELAAGRLAQIRGNGACCVLTCVYGNRAYEDTLIEMNDVAETCGFQVIAAVAAIAEHSIMHQYAANRPDQRDVENLREASRRILDKFQRAPGTGMSVQIPGSRPYRKAGGAGLVPKAGTACVNCGLCAAQCPAMAINREAIRTADAQKCISCMRCVVKCPHSARSVNGLLVSAASLAIKKACSQRKECELFL